MQREPASTFNLIDQVAMPFIPRRHEYRGEGWVSRRDYAARDERDEQDEQEEQESDDDDDRSALAHVSRAR